MEVRVRDKWRCAGLKTGSGRRPEPIESGRRRRSVVIEVGDGLTDGAFVEGGFLINEPGHERSRADLVDPPRNPFGVFEDALKGIVGKERPGRVARDAQLMFDVTQRFLKVQSREVAAHREPLLKGFINREVEHAA